MRKKIIIGVIALFVSLVGILSFIEYRYWQPYWDAEDLWMSEAEAENTLRVFAEQYLKEINLDYTVEKIVIKSADSNSYGEASYGEVSSRARKSDPREKGKVINAGSYDAKIIFSNGSKQGTLDMYYDASAIYGLTKENIFPDYKACAIESSECVLEIDEPLECQNKMSEEKDESNISRYFGCICEDTGDLMEKINKNTIPVSDCKECSRHDGVNDALCFTHTDGTSDPNQYFCTFYEEVLLPSIGKCVLDFYAELKSSPDNKTVVAIKTPNNIPSLTINGTSRKKTCSKTIYNLQAGSSEEIIDCNFSDNVCVEIYYDKHLISELNCSRAGILL